MHDLFISYSSNDRDEVAANVEALRAAGLTVWWDQSIGPDREWSDEIERALDEARFVLAFISRNVARSDRYFVQAEIKRAHDRRKLVPVRVGDFNMPLMIDGYVFGRQMVSIGSFAAFRTGPAFQRICGLVGRGVPLKPQGETVDDWFAAGPPLNQVALAIAIAVADSAQLSVVTDIAKALERRLNTLQQPAGNGAPALPVNLFESRTKNLEGVRALHYGETHGRLLLKIDCVRFREPERAAQLLAHVWDEFDTVRDVIVEWLNHLTHTANADLRHRIGLTIGTLARGHLASVLERLLIRWMMDEHPATRDVADIALSFAAVDAEAAATITELVREFAGSEDPAKLRAAIEIACGYTGSRLEDLSLEILKRVAKNPRQNFKVLDSMESAIKYMMAASLEADDTSLFDLDKLIVALAQWAREPDRQTPQRLPMYLFLTLMAELPVHAPESVTGVLSLQALMDESRGRPETRLATAAVFEAALRDFGGDEFKPREAAELILKRWQDKRDWTGDTDPLLSLAAAIYAACKTDRDRDRLAFAMRRRYSAEQLADFGRTIAGSALNDRSGA